MINQVFKLVERMLRWLYLKLWKEPKDIKGWVWTVCLWVAIACGAQIVQAGQPAPLLIGLGCLWLMKMQKPKKLGRPLPYRRRR